MNSHTNHNEWKQLVSAYIDDELSSEEKDTLHDHLVDCPACQKYLKELQALSLNVKSLSSNNQSLSPDLEQRLNNLNSRTERSHMNKQDVWKLLKATVPVVIILFMVTLSLQLYVKRGIQGRLKSTTDDVGYQYDPSFGQVDQLALGRKETESLRHNFSTDKKIASLEPQGASAGANTVSNGLLKASIANKSKGDKQIAWTDAATMVPGYAYPQEKDEEVRTRRQYIAPAAQPASVAGAYDGSYDYKMGSSHLEGLSISQYPYATIQLQESNTEQYDLINENEFQNVTDNPLSTFSIDVDTASYSNIRRFLSSNQLPPRDAVRIEEMINYFKYNYAQPSWGQPFSINLEHGICPWNPSHQLVLVGLQGKELTARQTPPSNLVFLIDVSGSMNDANKLPLLKESLKMMVAQLRPEERISMVVYAGNAGLVLDSASGYDKGLIMSAIDNLQAGGSTAGGQGIQLAYDVARKNFIHNGNNRVILATDGDFNVGVSSDSELVQMIEDKRKTGIFLTVLGFGTGNLQDGKMEKLANKGNGNYFYIDNLNEGKKVLVDELGSTLIAIAKDVKIQIEFNPNAVKAYRLIGYENRKLAKEDFNDDTKDAGELGAGHTVTALYEIIPAGSWENAAGNVDPLKYQKQTTKKPLLGNKNETMTVKLRYKEPNSETSKLITKVLQTKNTFGEAYYGSSDNLQFASAVAEFGMLLRNSQYTANSSYQSVIQRAQNSAYTDHSGHKSEFISLVQMAASLDNRVRPNVQVPQPHYPVYPQYEEQGGYNQK